MVAISEKQDINNNSNSTMDAYEYEIRSLRQEINDVHYVNDNLCRQLEEVNQTNEMLSRSPVRNSSLLTCIIDEYIYKYHILKISKTRK